MIPGIKPVIEIRGLSTKFFLGEGTVTAIDGVDLTIYENESIGIVGETGCGKSMTAFSMLRLVPSPGKIVAGSIYFKEPPEVRARRMEYEAEARSWYDRLPVNEKQKVVMLYGMPVTGSTKKREKAKEIEAAKRRQPPLLAPEGVINQFMSAKAAKLPKDDKIGRAAAQRSYDLMTRTPDQMRAIRGSSISMIFQDASTSLDPVFTVGNQLKEVISLHQNIYDDRILDKKVVDILRLVRIAAPESVAKQYPHELSGGMKQRVMTALALSCSPTLLIADEPTTALDVTIQAQILNLLKDVVKKSGSSMMLITHNLGVVAETSDRVCIMYAGRIVEDAETFTLFQSPLHPYTQGLLTAFPKLGEKKDELSVIRGTVPNLMKPFPGCPFVDRCDKSKDVCHVAKPVMLEVAPRHFVACHLYHQGGR